MLEPLKLLLPALIPSWRFFDVIAPSPRIEFALLNTPEDTQGSWQEFYPRPLHLPIRSMLKRMLWNPHWNETLYLVSCAERLMQNGCKHSRLEIAQRIKTHLQHSHANGKPYMQFRLVFVSKQGEALQKLVTFVSPVHPCVGDEAS